MAIDNRIVGENISKLRIHAEMTQQQLAGALNVSHQAVSKWETGAALPDIQTIQTITQMFGVSMEQLLNGEIAFEEPALEGHAQSNEPESFGKWLRDTLPDGTMDALRSAAATVRKTASDFTEKAGKTMADFGQAAESTVSDLSEKAEEMFHRLKKSSTVIDESGAEADEETSAAGQEENFETPEEACEEEKSEAGGGVKIDFENILAMAPFMSREKLGEIVMRMESVNDWESILKIAPFLSRQTIQKLTERLLDCPADRRVLKRLAPYAGAETLYRLILENLSSIDWETLRSLAPFLQRGMVDALTDYMITGVKPTKIAAAEKKKEGFAGAMQTAMDEIGNVVSEIGKAVGGIFTPSSKHENSAGKEQTQEDGAENACQEPVREEAPQEEKEASDEKAPAPSEMKNRIAKAALVSGNWVWINTHLFEIGDSELLTEIAVKAVRDFAAEDNAAIAVRAAAVLNEEQRARLFEAVLEEKAWGVAIALKNLADQDIAGRIVEEAAKAEGIERENAYLAIENFAPSAAKEILEKVTEKAIECENWVLINALTDAF